MSPISTPKIPVGLLSYKRHLGRVSLHFICRLCAQWEPKVAFLNFVPFVTHQWSGLRVIVVLTTGMILILFPIVMVLQDFLLHVVNLLM